MDVNDIMKEIGSYEKTHQNLVYSMLNECTKSEPDEKRLMELQHQLSNINTGLDIMFNKLEIAVNEDFRHNGE